MANILIFDDDNSLCQMLMELVQSIGHQAQYVLTLLEGKQIAFSGNFDVVFLDVKMPDGNGLELLEKIKEIPSQPEVIIITGMGDPDGAELAIKNGAWDYMQKPFSQKRIILTLKRVLQYRDQLKTNKEPTLALKRKGIIGESLKLTQCLESMNRAANSDANILITGETGTGKELFSRAIHDNSAQAGKSFIIVDCAALTETLAGSSLFGHEKGAFTGADQAAEGLVKQADGGTLFLDEVGELSQSNQKVFLRVLQEHCFRPVGSKRVLKSDFRLICATNRILDHMVHEGLFRQDLLYRIRTISLEIPPLRERPEDIRQLASHYLSVFLKKYELSSKEPNDDFFNILYAYSRPGNVRELVSAMEETVNNAGNDAMFFPQHLPQQIRIQAARFSVKQPTSTLGSPPTQNQVALPTLRECRDEAIATVENAYLKELISVTKGNIKQACEISGLQRTRLYILLKKYNISRNGWPD